MVPKGPPLWIQMKCIDLVLSLIKDGPFIHNVLIKVIFLYKLAWTA